MQNAEGVDQCYFLSRRLAIGRKTLTHFFVFAFFEIIDDVLANFIVVMVANEKSKDDIIAELNDSKSWLWFFVLCQSLIYSHAGDSSI